MKIIRVRDANYRAENKNSSILIKSTQIVFRPVEWEKNLMIAAK